VLVSQPAELSLTLSTWELLLRIVTAAALGGLIGLEREMGDQPAGFRTHMLVSLGSALFTLVGAFGVAPLLGEDVGARFDPTRVAAQIVTGIGFLGAGAILQQGLTVRGLTTAAALWVTAAIGMAVGLGYWGGAVFSALVTIVSLYGLKRLEIPLIRRLKRGRHRFVLDLDGSLKLSDFAQLIERHRIRAEKLSLAGGDEAGHALIATLQLPGGVSAMDLADEMSRLRGVRNVELD
jgi:putative Mg2+ transporter-C (MgtC) family protein